MKPRVCPPAGCYGEAILHHPGEVVVWAESPLL